MNKKNNHILKQISIFIAIIFIAIIFLCFIISELAINKIGCKKSESKEKFDKAIRNIQPKQGSFILIGDSIIIPTFEIEIKDLLT